MLTYMDATTPLKRKGLSSMQFILTGFYVALVVGSLSSAAIAETFTVYVANRGSPAEAAAQKLDNDKTFFEPKLFKGFAKIAELCKAGEHSCHVSHYCVTFSRRLRTMASSVPPPTPPPPAENVGLGSTGKTRKAA